MKRSEEKRAEEEMWIKMGILREEENRREKRDFGGKENRRA